MSLFTQKHIRRGKYLLFIATRPEAAKNNIAGGLSLLDKLCDDTIEQILFYKPVWFKAHHTCFHCGSLWLMRNA